MTIENTSAFYVRITIFVLLNVRGIFGSLVQVNIWKKKRKKNKTKIRSIFFFNILGQSWYFKRRLYTRTRYSWFELHVRLLM